MKKFSSCWNNQIFLFFNNMKSDAVSPNRLFFFTLLTTPQIKEKVTFKIFLTIIFFSVFLKLFQDMSWGFIEIRYVVKGDLCQQWESRTKCWVLANSWIFIISSAMIDTVEKKNVSNILIITMRLSASLVIWKKLFLFFQSNSYSMYHAPLL